MTMHFRERFGIHNFVCPAWMLGHITSVWDKEFAPCLGQMWKSVECLGSWKFIFFLKISSHSVKAKFILFSIEYIHCRVTFIPSKASYLKRDVALFKDKGNFYKTFIFYLFPHLLPVSSYCQQCCSLERYSSCIWDQKVE
jgi:hypothetical protein